MTAESAIPEQLPERLKGALLLIAEGEYVSKACKQFRINRGELWKKVDGPDAIPELASMYARAREMQADAHADRICELADDVLAGKYDYNSARVAIDALKWAASKLRPKVYGDRLDVSVEKTTELIIVDYSKQQRVLEVTPVSTSPMLPATAHDEHDPLALSSEGGEGETEARVEREHPSIFFPQPEPSIFSPRSAQVFSSPSSSPQKPSSEKRTRGPDKKPRKKRTRQGNHDSRARGDVF